jgi:hypothetical protein
MSSPFINEICGKRQIKYKDVPKISDDDFFKSLSVQDMRKILYEKKHISNKDISKLTRLELCKELVIYLKTRIKKTSPLPSPKALKIPSQSNTPKCIFGPLKKTMIYHIVQSKKEEMRFQNNDRIIYRAIHTPKDQNLVQFENEIASSITEHCPDHNILIYLSSINTPTIHMGINNILKDPKYRNIFHNTTIVNLTDSINSLIPTEIYVKKIINKFYDYEIQYIISNSSKKKLTDQWWFKLYFKLPPCSYGRLLQISGTCWFNSTFNSLMLVPKIAEIMKLKWYLLPQEDKNKVIEMESLDRCLSKTAPLKTLLYMMIYYILVQGEKPQQKHGNWIKEVAGYVKSVGLTHTESAYRQLKVADLQNNTNYANSYANGSTTLSTIKVILGTLFLDTEYKIIDMGYNNNYYKRLYEDKKSKNLQNLGVKWTELTVLPLILVILLSSNFVELRKSFILNNANYSLESGVMIISNGISGHAVSMLRCEDRWYIYDSNNILVECDWHMGNIDPYKKKLADHGLEYAKHPHFMIAHLEYVRESF